MSFTRYLGLFLLLITVNVIGQTYADYNGRKSMLQGAEEGNNTGEVKSQNGLLAGSSLKKSYMEVKPEQYYVGPGDAFFISIRGIEDITFNGVVTPEYGLYLPKLGFVNLKDLYLPEAKEKITNKIADEYNDVAIDVALMSVRDTKINVIGYLENVTSLIVPANFTIIDIIKEIGGTQDKTDLRNIMVTFHDGSEKNVDLVKFIRLGDEENNPGVSGISTIKFEKIDKTITVNGQVKYPGIYEFREDDNAKKIIELAGGYLDNAIKDTVELVSFDKNFDTLVSKYFATAELETTLLQKGDKLIVRKIPEYMVDRIITIKGEVKFPGIYKIKENGTSLYNLINNEAGGFTKEASLSEANVTRNIGVEKPDPELERLKLIPRSEMTDEEYDYFKARSRERKGRMVVDFNRLFINEDMNEDLLLKKGDVIVIPEKTESITLVGQVLNPGNIIFNKDYTIYDYIELAGGFSWRAVDDDIRVIKAESGEWVDADEVEHLKPGDIIWVPEEAPPAKFWDVFKDSLLIVGQVAALITSIVVISRR